MSSCEPSTYPLTSLASRFFMVSHAFSSLHMSYRDFSDWIHKLKGEALDIARSLLVFYVRSSGRKKAYFGLDGSDVYYKATRNTVWECTARYGRERCGRYIDKSRFMEVVYSLSMDKEFPFANEMGELYEIYTGLSKLYSRLYNIKREAVIGCSVVDVDSHGSISSYVLEKIVANYWGGAVMILRSGERTIEEKEPVSPYVELSIAVNCYDKFMQAIGELEKSHRELASIVEGYGAKLKEYNAMLKMFEEMYGKGDDQDDD